MFVVSRAVCSFPAQCLKYHLDGENSRIYTSCHDLLSVLQTPHLIHPLNIPWTSQTWHGLNRTWFLPSSLFLLISFPIIVNGNTIHPDTLAWNLETILDSHPSAGLTYSVSKYISLKPSLSSSSLKWIKPPPYPSHHHPTPGPHVHPQSPNVLLSVLSTLYLPLHSLHPDFTI